MRKIKNTLSSTICLPIILTIGFVGWFSNLDFITIPLLCLYAGLLLAFCDDVKNLFAVAFSVQFFINEIEKFSDYVVLGIGILLFIIGIIVFLIRKLAIEKVPTSRGKLFPPFVVALIAYLIGGIWGYFNLLNAVIITAMTSATYFLYWIAINFTHNLRAYLQKFFIALGIILALQLTISYAFVDEKFSTAILSKNVIWIGLQNINVVAIYFMLAMFSVFTLALHHKYDYLITLSGLFFAICVYFTYCRMGTLVCFILMLVGIIYIFAKSKNKTIFVFIGIVGVFAIDVFCIFKFDTVEKLLSHHLHMGIKGNGRDTLWPWCIERFLQSPIFGVGFTSTTPVPSVTTDNIIMAHNSILQYLTSLGIVGTLLIGFYYVQRARIVFTKFNEFKCMNMLALLSIVLSGITDQAPTMDIFILCISTLLVALAEMDTDEILVSNEKTTNEQQMDDNNETPSTNEALEPPLQDANNNAIEEQYNTKSKRKKSSSNTRSKKQTTA